MWSVNAAVRADTLVATIAANLVAGGWTEEDAVNKVYSSTNNQGVKQYLQVSQVGTYTYILLRGWRVWSGGAGTDGTNASYHWINLNSAAVGSATPCDLYMSTTTNRVIIVINVVSTGYLNWGYFGGLGSIAGLNDPSCVLTLSSYEAAGQNKIGQILQGSGGGSAYWGRCLFLMAVSDVYASNTASSVDAYFTNTQNSGIVVSQSGSVILLPILTAEWYKYTTSETAGVGLGNIRGDLDGILFCPLSGGYVASFDTLTVGADTYLVIVPRGSPASDTTPWTGQTVLQGIVIKEA